MASPVGSEVAARLNARRRLKSALITVIDGHPATLAWLGSVAGHRTVPLGVEHFGQTGTIGDLYRHFGIDAQGILEKVAGLTAGRPLGARPR